MPTDYTADPTATQAPAPKPNPEVIPIVRLPVDLELADAVSIYQPHKAEADHIAWLYKPKAKASDWAKWIMTYRSAAGHKRWVWDHFGFPAGSIQHFREQWLSAAAIAVKNHRTPVGQLWNGSAYVMDVGNMALPGWYHRGDDSGNSAVAFLEAIAPSFGSRQMSMVLDTANDAWVSLTTDTLAKHHADGAAVLGFDMVQRVALSNCRTLLGLIDNVTAPGGASDNNGAWFEHDANVSGNWQCAVRATNGGAVAYTDSGVAAFAGTRMRFRIVILGANVDDAATARILFFINGSLVENRTTALPAAGKHIKIFFGLQRVGAAAGNPFSDVGIVNFASNTWLDSYE